MSRTGLKPVEITKGVAVAVNGPTVSVKGTLGELHRTMPAGIAAVVEDGKVWVRRADETRRTRSCHGLSRTLVANMIEGVTRGFRKQLEIQGVGFKAQVQGQKVLLSLGFASPKVFMAPAGVKVTDEGGVKLTITGVDKEKVGDTAARIRGYFPVEPYKGKGIRYTDERVRRKVGKTVA